MILSRHRLLGFWLKKGDQQCSPTQKATRFLEEAESDLLERCQKGYRRRGGINSGYNPEDLIQFPGYAWLSQRLQEYAQKHPDFDQGPENVKELAFRHDPFPAFNWQVLPEKSDLARPHFYLEVLVGRDVVVFHQWELEQLPHGAPQGRSCRLRPDRAKQNLFKAEFVQATAEVDETLEPADFNWNPRSFTVTDAVPDCFPLTCAVREGTDPRSFEGLLLTEGSATEGAELPMMKEAHIKSTLFLGHLCIALTSLSKLRYEYKVAESEVPILDKRLEERQRSIDALLHDSSSSKEILNRHRDQVDDRKALDGYGGLIEVCRLNSKRFKAIASQLKINSLPWVKNARKWCRYILDNLESKASRLQLQYETINASLDAIEEPTAAKEVQNPSRRPENSGRRQIFISYSHCHRDKEIFERLKDYLRVYLSDSWDKGLVWDDSRIEPGDDWHARIQSQLLKTRIALVLVSIDYLGSEYARPNELRPILEYALHDGVKLLWILLGDCPYQMIGLDRWQALNDLKYPLMRIEESVRETELDKICKKIAKAYTGDRPGKGALKEDPTA